MKAILGHRGINNRKYLVEIRNTENNAKHKAIIKILANSC